MGNKRNKGYVKKSKESGSILSARKETVRRIAKHIESRRIGGTRLMGIYEESKQRSFFVRDVAKKTKQREILVNQVFADLYRKMKKRPAVNSSHPSVRNAYGRFIKKPHCATFRIHENARKALLKKFEQHFDRKKPDEKQIQYGGCCLEAWIVGRDIVDARNNFPEAKKLSAFGEILRECSEELQEIAKKEIDSWKDLGTAFALRYVGEKNHVHDWHRDDSRIGSAVVVLKSRDQENRPVHETIRWFLSIPEKAKEKRNDKKSGSVDVSEGDGLVMVSNVSHAVFPCNISDRIVLVLFF